MFLLSAKSIGGYDFRRATDRSCGIFSERPEAGSCTLESRHSHETQIGTYLDIVLNESRDCGRLYNFVFL